MHIFIQHIAIIKYIIQILASIYATYILRLLWKHFLYNRRANRDLKN